MSEQNTARPEWRQAIDRFLQTSDVNVILTYGFAADSIVFPCRIALTDDEQNARQKFYAQPAETQEAGKHKYNVEMLCSILSGKPKGLPGFDELMENSKTTPPDALREYLMAGGFVAEKIANEAIERYYRLIQPAEFFR